MTTFSMGKRQSKIKQIQVYEETPRQAANLETDCREISMDKKIVAEE